MKLLALIPARAGSKRVPNKNIRVLGTKPLIEWTIDAALGVPELSDILVSTDSIEIANISKRAGVLVPWQRPSELAADTAPTMAVCMHALDWYEKEKGQVDGLVLLQPTSPFRTTQNIREAVKLFSRTKKRSIVSFSPADSHPMWCYRIEGEKIEPFVHQSKSVTRSQDLPPAHTVNGAIYIATPNYLRENGAFLKPDTMPFYMDDKRESLDIDTEFDWFVASALVCQMTLG